MHLWLFHQIYALHTFTPLQWVALVKVLTMLFVVFSLLFLHLIRFIGTYLNPALTKSVSAGHRCYFPLKMVHIYKYIYMLFYSTPLVLESILSLCKCMWHLREFQPEMAFIIAIDLNLFKRLCPTVWYLLLKCFVDNLQIVISEINLGLTFTLADVFRSGGIRYWTRIGIFWTKLEFSNFLDRIRDTY